MHAYCVGEFHMTEDVACKRLAVARAARQFPAIFDAVAAGQLGLTSILMLARHLTPDSADRLLAAAAGRTNSELKLLMAGHAPQPDLPTLVEAVHAGAAE